MSHCIPDEPQELETFDGGEVGFLQVNTETKATQQGHHKIALLDCLIAQTRHDYGIIKVEDQSDTTLAAVGGDCSG